VSVWNKSSSVRQSDAVAGIAGIVICAAIVAISLRTRRRHLRSDGRRPANRSSKLVGPIASIRLRRKITTDKHRCTSPAFAGIKTTGDMQIDTDLEEKG